MINKLSLANKYRPKVFDDVSEQTSIKTILENQIATNNLKHVYLFCGGAGTGKTTCARIVANMINEGKGRPIEIDCASHNSVDDARAIIDQCRTRPFDCKYKIFILDEVHMVSVAGFNAMLKLFEEPPEFVIIIMCTTDPQKIIPTILSRTQRFNFNRISTEGIIKRLTYILNSENITDFEPEAVSYIARLAKGGMRDSITTLEKCLDYDSHLTLDNVRKVTSGGVTEETMLLFLSKLLEKDAKSVLLQFNDIYLSGIDISLFIKLYIEFLQNCLKYLITQSANIVTISDIVINWLDNNTEYKQSIQDELLSLIDIRTTYSSIDLKILVESWIIEVCK